MRGAHSGAARCIFHHFTADCKLLFDEALARHLCRHGKSHDFKKGGREVGEDTVLSKRCVLVLLGNEYDGHGVGRVRREG